MSGNTKSSLAASALAMAALALGVAAASNKKSLNAVHWMAGYTVNKTYEFTEGQLGWNEVYAKG